MKRCSVIVISILSLLIASCSKHLTLEDCVGTYKSYTTIDEHTYEKEAINVTIEDKCLKMEISYSKGNGDAVQALIDTVKLDSDVNLSEPIYITTGEDYLFDHEFIFKKNIILWRFILKTIPDKNAQKYRKIENIEDKEYFELKRLKLQYN